MELTTIDSIFAKTISGSPTSSGNNLEINNLTEVNYIADGAVSVGDVVVGNIIVERQTDPVSLPSAAARGIAFGTCNGESYLVSTWTSATPYFATYKLTAGAWVKLDPASTPPASGAYSADLCEFNGELYLALGLTTTSVLAIYKMVDGAWVKQTNPTSMPVGNVTGVSMCVYNSVLYLLTAHSSSPYTTIYQLVAGVWTKFTNPSPLPASAGLTSDFCVCNNNLYAAIAHASSPYITVYQLISGVWTKLANPSPLPVGRSYSAALGAYNNTLYLSISHANTPFVTTYKWIDSAWVKLNAPSTPPESYGNGIDLCTRSTTYGDELYLSIALVATPFIAVYRIVNDKYIKIANPSASLSGVGYDVQLGMIGTDFYSIHGNAGSPYVHIHIIHPFKMSTLSGSNISKYISSTSTGVVKTAAADGAECTIYRLRD